jgi:hypothetical protein
MKADTSVTRGSNAFFQQREASAQTSQTVIYKTRTTNFLFDFKANDLTNKRLLNSRHTDPALASQLQLKRP